MATVPTQVVVEQPTPPVPPCRPPRRCRQRRPAPPAPEVPPVPPTPAAPEQPVIPPAPSVEDLKAKITQLTTDLQTAAAARDKVPRPGGQPPGAGDGPGVAGHY